MPVKDKEYLGDAVYVAHDGHQLWLTTSDGLTTTNEIAIDPQVYAALVNYVRRLNERFNPGGLT